MTLIESETWFATQSSLPSGRSARLTGSVPTSIVCAALSELVLITRTLPMVVSTMYSFEPSGEAMMASACGLSKSWAPSASCSGGGALPQPIPDRNATT